MLELILHLKNLLFPSAQGDTVVDLLPGGFLIKNAWSGVRTEPRDGAAAQSGEVGFAAVLNAGVVVGYRVEGYGKNAIILTVQSGS